MAKKLRKSNNHRMFFGVCGGMAEYFDLDPTIVRIIWIVASLAFGSGILAYIICAILMPSE